MTHKELQELHDFARTLPDLEWDLQPGPLARWEGPEYVTISVIHGRASVIVDSHTATGHGNTPEVSLRRAIDKFWRNCPPEVAGEALIEAGHLLGPIRGRCTDQEVPF